MMKETIPTLLKFLGALAITTAIFFALSPKDEINDEVVNQAMEFLGTKLLAMAPQHEKSGVEKDFAAFREQAIEGKISDEQFKDVAVAIINAEAEGKTFNREQIDSLLTSIDEAGLAKADAEIAQAEAEMAQAESAESAATPPEDLHTFSARIQEFAKFEKEWHTKIPLPPAADSTLPPPFPRRPLYRVDHNFVVEVDSIAIAEIAAAHAQAFAAEAPRAVVVQPAEVHRALRDLSRELPKLKIEMRRLSYHMQTTDSLKKMMILNMAPEFRNWPADWGRIMADSLKWDKAMSDSMKKALKAMRQANLRQARIYQRMADSTRQARGEHRWEYKYDNPPPTGHPPLPPKREPPKREKPKPPQNEK